MCNGVLQRLVVVAIGLLGTAACEIGAGVDRHSGGQTSDGELATLRMHRVRPQVLRAQLDAGRRIVWTLETEGVGVHDATTGVTLHSVRLPGWMLVGEGYACPPDLAFGPGGHVFVTSNAIPALWRVDAETFEVMRYDVSVDGAGGRDAGFTGLAYSSGHEAFFAVNGVDGLLWRIDAKLDRAEPVTLAARLPAACSVSVVPGGARMPAPDMLCVHTDAGTWIVTVADADRPAVARPSPCRAEARAALLRSVQQVTSRRATPAGAR